MKIFLLGLSKSGRTTVAETLAEAQDNYYVSAMDWLRSTFRAKNRGEDHLDYERNLNEYLSERLKLNPFIVSDNIESIIKSCPNKNYVIDGVIHPQDFVKLFNYNEDLVVVLNRLDNDTDSTDQDNIAMNTIRDYCYWLSSMNLLAKEKWVEYNFRAGADSGGTIKKMGSRNLVYIVKSLKDVGPHLKELILSS